MVKSNNLGSFADPIIWSDNYDENGKLRSRLQYIDNKLDKEKDAFYIPIACIGPTCSCLCFIALLFTSALGIVYFAPRPGLYGESCEHRSCTRGLNLKCINNVCDCVTEKFYRIGCVDKYIYMQQCHSNYKNCVDNQGLSCQDGVCKCNNTQYWSGTSCLSKNTYNHICTNDVQCRTDLLLYCDKVKSSCLCPQNRYISKNYIKSCFKNFENFYF